MSKEDSTMGIEPNLGGLLCYTPCCVGLIVSVVAAIVEKKSRFIRFHAFQSLLFHGVAMVLCIGLQVFLWLISMASAFIGGIIGMGLMGAVGFALLGVSIFLMTKAYANEEYKLPTLGDLAMQWV